MASITRINVKTAPKATEAKKEAAATPVDEKALPAAGDASEAIHAASAGHAASVEEAAVAAMAQAAENAPVATATNGTPAADDTPATIEAPVTAEPSAPGDAMAIPPAEKVDAKPVDDRLWRAIAVGDVVLMADYSDGEFQGWWPAKVITLVEGRASCVFIDYEEMGHFSRQITEFALLHPMHAG
ncbi:hypothetical protein [Aquabacter sediminis]|uniref:hypothetical protein n=1 Tax=Aquabacter sediminis TaxID=3029197 RepID=UPI00237E1DEF|nr:hypothetical protein [Aquabacter sp. P-9]MDE1568814.1 hypothetical protein [Aquabacter sp. P-9]